MKAPDLDLPLFSDGRFALSTLRGRPVALLFWGTFSEPCYAHLQALQKACEAHRKSGLACVAIDTMEIFTAVGKTAAYQAEMVKVHKTLWKQDSLAVDLFMRAERTYGLTELPTLLLIDAQGRIVDRQDGPYPQPFEDIARDLGTLLGTQTDG